MNEIDPAGSLSDYELYVKLNAVHVGKPCGGTWQEPCRVSTLDCDDDLKMSKDEQCVPQDHN